MSPSSGFIPALAAAILLVGGPLAGQGRCGVLTAGLHPTVGALRIATAGGENIEGLAVGIVAARSVGRFDIAAEGEYALLEGDAAAPVSLRLRATRPIAVLGSLRLCGSALAGGTVIRTGDEDALSGSAGLAATAALPGGVGSFRITPYLGVRGLVGYAAVTALGTEATAMGLSVGGEGGIGMEWGRAKAAVRATMDGFDAALGAVHAPALALRVEAGWAF